MKLLVTQQVLFESVVVEDHADFEAVMEGAEWHRVGWQVVQALLQVLDRWVLLQADLPDMVDRVNLHMLSPVALFTHSLIWLGAIASRLVHWSILIFIHHRRGCQIIHRNVVSMRYDEEALHGLEVSVEPHELVQILHANAVPVADLELDRVLVGDSAAPLVAHFANLVLVVWVFRSEPQELEVKALVVCLNVHAVQVLFVVGKIEVFCQLKVGVDLNEARLAQNKSDDENSLLFFLSKFHIDFALDCDNFLNLRLAVGFCIGRLLHDAEDLVGDLVLLFSILHLLF